MPKSDLAKRCLTGFPLAGAALLYITLAGRWVFLAVTLALALVTLYEYAHGLLQKGVSLHLPGFLLAGALYFGGFTAFWLGYAQAGGVALTATGGMFFLLPFFTKPNREPNPTNQILWLVLGLIWVVLPFFLLLLLRFVPPEGQGPQLILVLVLAVAFSDIFAYLGGRSLGRHKLAPSISPNKTWEGSLCGVAGGLVVALSTAHFTLPQLAPLSLALALGVVIVLSQIGDLAESKFKRFCGIKDSSNFIPGHGGFLDRLDALLLGLPAFWLMLYLLGIPQAWSAA